MKVLIKTTNTRISAIKLNTRSTWRLKKKIKVKRAARSRFRVSATGELHLHHN